MSVGVAARTTFAGSTYSLLTEACRTKLMEASPDEFGAMFLGGVESGCLNVVELKEWLRNAPDKKPMFPEISKDGKRRGMPALGLTENQINDLVEYLKTLK